MKSRTHIDDALLERSMTWVGNYRRRGHERHLARLMLALGMAGRCGIPLIQAIRHVQDEIINEGPGVYGARWLRMLDRVGEDLWAGRRLGDALDNHMRWRIPCFYIAAIRKAEQDGKLDIVLPMLADKAHYQRCVREDRLPFTPLIAFYIVVIMLVSFSYRRVILPVLLTMMADFGKKPGFEVEVLSWLWLVVMVALGSGLAVYLLFRSLRVREAVLPWLPGFAGDTRRQLVRDLAQGMGVLVATGDDVLSAAEWCLASTTSPWLRPRLARFVTRVRAGENWAAAWSAMGLGDGMYQWLVVNAASRQDPASGFDELSRWLHHDIGYTTRALRRWLMPWVVIATGAVVFIVSASFFRTLSRISLVFFDEVWQ